MKISRFIILVSFLAATFVSHAQKPSQEYFVGKWVVFVKGTPGGDAKLFLLLEKADNKITGVVKDSTGKEISKINSSELKDYQLTLYFTAQGYDVNLELTKKDDDHVNGRLMGMFDADGDRVKY